MGSRDITICGFCGIDTMYPCGCPTAASRCSMYISGSTLKDNAPKAADRQVGGQHYKSKAIQPVDYILANALNFCEGNVVKYVTRWRDKGGVQDLEKAKHYLEFLIEDARSKEAKVPSQPEDNH